MQGANALETPVAPELEADQANDQGVLASKVEVGDKDYILDAIASYSADVPLSSLSFQDEEICSGYQYPLDDSLERNYCSDFFGHIPNSNPRLFKNSFVHRSLKESENLHYDATLLSARGNLANITGIVGSHPSMESCVSNSKAAMVDAAMTLGAGRAAGLIPQTGAEAFNKVRTAIQPSLSKCLDNVTQTSGFKSFSLPPSLSTTSYNGALQTHSSQKSRTVDATPEFATLSQKGKIGAVNFPHFSLPVAETRDNQHLTSLATAATNNQRVRQRQGKWYGRVGKDGLGSGESSVAESTTTVMTDLGSCKEVDFQKQWAVASQLGDDRPDWQLPSGSLPAYGSDTARGKKVDMPNCFNSNISGATLTATVSDTPDAATTSPSRGSGNSTEKSGKEIATTSKRKVSQGDESEYQSEDAEEVAVNAKKPPLGRSRTSKRSRAAEIHNQSERRRRDRINEKMRALQDLIPNSNKTDKASMLDEAIEYLKMLQSQVQYLQMQQMRALPHMRVGMGMGVSSLGMGMTAGRAIVPVPSIPGQAYPLPAGPVTGFQPTVSSLSINESQQCQQSSIIPPTGVMDPYDALLTCQQQQPVHFSMNMDMYGAFWQQQQLQQQQQSQLLQGVSWSKPAE
eukprot:c29178_g1_i4 orf=674-2554(+)